MLSFAPFPSHKQLCSEALKPNPKYENYHWSPSFYTVYYEETKKYIHDLKKWAQVNRRPHDKQEFDSPFNVGSYELF